MQRDKRIAILAHSTNPRGGVVHALELGDALTRLGHAVTVHAPDTGGKGFFRDTLCRTVCVPATSAGRDTTAMVERRIADYVRYFSNADHRRFDIWHAQDGISANALATLREQGHIHAFARTVHHVDTFADPRLCTLQSRSIAAADQLFVVSRLWQQWLARECGRDAILVDSGVDMQRFSPTRDAPDEALRRQLNIPLGAPVFLSVGGVEERKNTLRLVEAFSAIRAHHAGCRLVIAGGASLLDHDAYQQRFTEALGQSFLPGDAVICTGPLPQALMPALYRAADCLVFPSVKEGFGLVVLEAMASGVPVVTSRIAPFTEYLAEKDVLWCDPFDPPSIAGAMAASFDPSRRSGLIERGFQVAARHSWSNAAHAHLAAYATMREPTYA